MIKLTRAFINELIRLIKLALKGKADINHSHSLATQYSSGFMSATDKKKLDTLGFVQSVMVTFTTTGGTTQNALFNGNLTSDDYTCTLSVPSTVTAEQMQAMASSMPIITTAILSGSNTNVTVKLLSGTAPSINFSVILNVYKTRG